MARGEAKVVTVGGADRGPPESPLLVEHSVVGGCMASISDLSHAICFSFCIAKSDRKDTFICHNFLAFRTLTMVYTVYVSLIVMSISI